MSSMMTTSSRPSVSEASGARRMPPPNCFEFAAATEYPVNRRGEPPSIVTSNSTGFQPGSARRSA